MSDEFDEPDLSSHTDMVTRDQWSAPDILSDANLVKVDKKCILKFTKQSRSFSSDVKNCCKVLHFSSELSFDKVLLTIDRLDPRDYPHLFIFVINVIKFTLVQEKVEKLKENVLKFGPKRPLLVQLTSEAENFSIFFYKEELSIYFLAWYPTFWKTSEELSDLHEFLNLFLNEKTKDFKSKVLIALATIRNRSIILRFLWTLNLSDNFYKNMIMNVASNGTEVEFLAALDAPVESEAKFFNAKAFQHVRNTFDEDSDPTKYQSVLLTAVENQNTEVFDYLRDNWSHLLQELPFDHQVSISTAALETGQLDVLCDLLDYADYPFPDNFKPDSIEHETLEEIIRERIEFEAAIKDERMEDIEEFISKYSDLKIVYNISNKSALKQASNASNINVYTFLKLRGFNSINQLENLKEAEKKYVEQQRKQNINEGLADDQKSVNLLCNRSLIYNKKISKEREKEYRKKIRSWFKDINKIQNGPEFLSVAASCDKLKILFDFEDETVKSASLDESGAFGSVFTVSKWIFIGAKLADKSESEAEKREQQIKGVLAHEMCHYVMKLVYENQENPYYNYREDIKKIFDEIVKIVNQWSAEDSEDPDDECNEIISSVFKRYNQVDFHPELIVRVVQILVEFDDSEDKLKHLQERYKVLFEYWFNHVVTELQNFLQRNPDVLKLNRLFELLTTVQSIKFKPCNRIEIEAVISSKIIVVQTNMPMLLFVNIHKKLHEKWGSFITSQNIFVDPNKLKNQQLLDDFKETCMHNSDLKTIVDCSKEVPDDLKRILTFEDTNFIFVVSNDENAKKLVQMCKKNMLKDVTKIELNYNWSDLSEKSQKLMLETKVNFQNNSEVLLKDLLAFENDLSEFFDSQLLNLLVENQPVIINTNKVEEVEKLFKLQFQQRSFIKKLKSNEDNIENYDIIEKTKFIINKLKLMFTEESKIMKSQQELFNEVKNQQYVLISDYAGNGKSWAMKNIARVLCEQDPTKWVTYVDLKQFIDEFKAQKVVPEFAAFMVEQILKQQQKFERKIFQKMYENGIVFIFFDGFDEIAPDCAEFVSKLAQNFQQNGGNQLWIATRDFFEVDLKQQLKLIVAYSLEEMTEDEGVDMITKTWLLMDLKEIKQEPTLKQDFDEKIKRSLKYESYQKKAYQMIKKAKASRNSFIGLPQLFKMLADGFKDEENIENIQGPKIYVEFIEILYKRWSREKGLIREEANVKSQRYELNFWKFHEYFAILSLFPELALMFSFLCDVAEWPEEEVIACGIMSKSDGKYYFIHETFREFFVVEPIAKALKQKNIHKEVMKVVDQILTVNKFKIVRMFLLPVLNEQDVLEKFKPKMKWLILNQDGFFGELFADNNDNLVDFAMEVLKLQNDKEIKSFLKTNFKVVIKNAQSSRMFNKLQDFLFEILETKDLKDLIINQGIFHIIVESNLEIEVFNNFVKKTEAKIDREFVRKTLTDFFLFEISLGQRQRPNIFAFLTRSSNLSATKVQEFLKALESLFSIQEIFELMRKCTEKEETILQYCIRENNTNALQTLGIEIAKYFALNELPQGFIDLLTNYDIYNRNIFHFVALNDKIVFLKIFWKLLLQTFDNREKLKNFLLQKDIVGINFLYGLISRTENPKIIEFTLKVLKENFNKTQFQEIFINSKSWFGGNFFKLISNLDQVVLQDILGDDFQELYENNGKLYRNSKNGNLKMKVVDMIIVPIVRVNKNVNILRLLSKWFPSRCWFFGIRMLIIFIIIVLKTWLFCELNTFVECFEYQDFYLAALIAYALCYCSILLFLGDHESHLQLSSEYKIPFSSPVELLSIILIATSPLIMLKII